MIREAIILAGGLGTRLRSAVPETPKCLAPVGGVPFLAYVIDYFRSQGIGKFIFALGYKHELFQDFLHSRLKPSDYRLSIEEEPLGTGGAIRLACEKADTKTALVLNGDTFFRIRTDLLSAFHEEQGLPCTLSLKPMRNFDRYGVVGLDPASSHVTDFQEKKYYEEGLINGGVYALDTAPFLEAPLPRKFSFEKDWLEKEAGKDRLSGLVQDAYFIDIGIPEDYERAGRELQELRTDTAPH